MEDLSKEFKKKTPAPVLDVDRYKRIYGIREDGTTSQTASILAAAGVKPEPKEQAITPATVDNNENVFSQTPPGSNRKSKLPLITSTKDSSTGIRVSLSPELRKKYDKYLCDAGVDLFNKTGKLSTITHGEFIGALLTIWGEIPAHQKLLVQTLEKRRNQKS